MTFQCIKNLLFPRVRRTLKDFVFGICVLRGVMQYTKGAPHLLNPFVHFFCVAQKKWTLSERCSIRGRSDLRTSVYVRKRAPLRGACRDRTIAHFFEMSAIVCAYLVFGFAECFRCYCCQYSHAFENGHY